MGEVGERGKRRRGMYEGREERGMEEGMGTRKGVKR